MAVVAAALLLRKSPWQRELSMQNVFVGRSLIIAV